MVKLSVAIVTRNEEKWIKNCLLSAKFAGEVVVIDDFSTDQTATIAKSLGAKVFKEKWRGFSAQRNRAFQHTLGDWVLFLDCDERISQKLAQEIKEQIKNTQFSAFYISHLNIILGKKMRYGGWWPDYQLRLVRRDRFLGWQGELHEHFEVEGKIGYLESPLIHLTHRGLYWMMQKTIRYSDIEAELLSREGKRPVTWLTLVRKMLGEFWRRGVKNAGFLDGLEGWFEIFYQTFSVFTTYFRVWEKGKTKDWDSHYQEIDRKLKDQRFDV